MISGPWGVGGIIRISFAADAISHEDSPCYRFPSPVLVPFQLSLSLYSSSSHLFSLSLYSNPTSVGEVVVHINCNTL
jgi:hypothetical protein